MSDESSTPTKTAKEEIKEQSPQVIVATAIAGISQMLDNKEHGKILAILAPVISLAIVWLVRLLSKLGAFLFNRLVEESESTQSGIDKPLDVLLKGYIKENKREARWLLPFSAERKQLNEARTQLRRRLHDYQMGKLIVSVDVVSTNAHRTDNQQSALPPAQ
jgi:DNA-binding transcriptional ArsR family regulator